MLNVAKETAQWDGYQGVVIVKQWLESTTHISLPFNCYEDEIQCTLQLLGGKKTKLFDLAGHFLGDVRRQLVVESKHYTTVGHQPEHYTEYLATAYSATAQDLEVYGKSNREYAWVTWHPFSQTKWTSLTTAAEVKAALATHADLLDGREVDDDIVLALIDRLWLLVMNSKQEELMLTDDEMRQVFTVIKRKS